MSGAEPDGRRIGWLGDGDEAGATGGGTGLSADEDCRGWGVVKVKCEAVFRGICWGRSSGSDMEDLGCGAQGQGPDLVLKLGRKVCQGKLDG